jgi:hypothetical protein
MKNLIVSMQITAAVVCLALGAAAVQAASQSLRAIELAVETSTRDLTLPAGDAGSLSVKPCAGCKALVLFTGARTRYFLDGLELPVTELRRALTGRSDADLVLLYGRGTSQITRVLATLPVIARQPERTPR